MITGWWNWTRFLPFVVVAGCVATHKVDDAPRVSVRFENQKAAEIFYEAYLCKNYQSSSHAGLYVEAGFPSPYSKRNLVTDNVVFNAAVQIADQNHDGVISENEALDYRCSQTKRQAVFLAVERP